MVRIAMYFTVACVFVLGQAMGEEKMLDGRVEARALLDRETGQITFLLDCLSDKSVRIHLESIEWIHSHFEARRFRPDLTWGPLDNDEFVWPKIMFKSSGWSTRRKKRRLDRVVDLKKGEAVARSFMVWELTIWSDIVAGLKKHREYEVRTSVWLQSFGAEGVYNCRIPARKTRGFRIDRALARKFERLRAAAEKGQTGVNRHTGSTETKARPWPAGTRRSSPPHAARANR